MSRTTVHSTKSEESTSSPSEPSHHGKASKSSTSTVDANGIKSLLASVTAIAGPALALTAKDRRRAVRLRKGGEKVIPTITALSEQFGLSVPSYPASAITANVTQANSLVAVHKQLVTATKQVSDAIFSAQSKGWEGATVHYSVLKRLARTDGDLATALAPVTEFFAQKSPAVVKADEEKRGHRKGVKEPKGTETAPAESQATSAQAPAAPAAAPAATPATTPNGAAHS
ncbi:MAG: hypothetical protein ACLQVI_10615 [Polyangiaceae bacterium]